MSKLAGTSFCFTGALETMTRADAHEFIQNEGGVFSTSVIRGLDFLVTNTPHSGTIKNQKAQEYGTAIIDEEQFLQLVKGEAGVRFLRLNKIYNGKIKKEK